MEKLHETGLRVGAGPISVPGIAGSLGRISMSGVDLLPLNMNILYSQETAERIRAEAKEFPENKKAVSI